MEDDDDTPTPTNGSSNGHGHTSTVPGGEIGVRLRDVEARLVTLDSRDTEQHAAVVQRLDALTRATEEVGGKLVAGLAALEEAHRQRVVHRVIAVVEEAIKRLFTPASAPIYAAAVLVAVVAATAVPIVWSDLHVGRQASAANVDSDEGGDMPASVSGAGVSELGMEP